MRVGGTDIDARFTYFLSAGLTAAFVLSWFFLSFYTAVLLLTAFCFGAGIISFVLDFSNKNEVPNILSRLTRPSTEFISRQKVHKNEVQIPVEIDQALEQLYERIFQEHIYPWYSLLSYDDDFVQEIRYIFRHATLEIWKRLSKVDLTKVITQKAIPIGLSHLDAMMKTVLYRKKVGISSEESHEVLFEYLGPNIHPASLSRLREVEYCRAIATNLVTILLPKKFQTSRSVVLLVTDILQGAVLQPVLDLLPDPDHCINYLIAEAFHPGPSRKFPEPSGKYVPMLENFVSNHLDSRQSALKMDFSAILKDQGSLFSFMKFLKEENSLNPLQFCLSAEHFNKCILTPEINEDEMKALHKEAVELYDLYFKPNAKHKIDVDDSLGEEIFSILSGPVSDVVLLRTTTPLFKAYEEVFRQLESRACPAFHKSEEYFIKLLHGREGETMDGNERINERAKSEAFSKPSEKLGRSLSKLKSEVLGKSVEGIVDPSSTDCAFDIAEIFDDQHDMTMIPSCNGNDFRDLSAWRISIPKLATSSSNSSGKPFFVFIIEVQRLDIKSNMDDGSDLRFKVCRRYNEFYALEAKLTEFHGEFDDVKLPPKAKFAAWKGLDVLQSKKESFQNYLISLLLKPALKESDILYTFLTSNEEFTMESSNLGLGKMIKNVPIKLTKEKGQSLQNFIDTFVAQIQSPPPKPKYESVIGDVQDHDGTTERQVDQHHLFKNNFNSNNVSNTSKDMVIFLKNYTSITSFGVYDTILYLLATVFRVSQMTLRFLIGVGLIIRQTFNCYIDYAIDCKLFQVLNTMRIAHLCRLLEGALFEPHDAPTEAELIIRRETALKNFQNYIRPLLTFVTGPEKYEEGTQIVFEALQDPITNKHLALVLLDTVVAEIFPELKL